MKGFTLLDSIKNNILLILGAVLSFIVWYFIYSFFSGVEEAEQRVYKIEVQNKVNTELNKDTLERAKELIKKQKVNDEDFNYSDAVTDAVIEFL